VHSLSEIKAPADTTRYSDSLFLGTSMYTRAAIYSSADVLQEEEKQRDTPALLHKRKTGGLPGSPVIA
jgi:hypothetical protein